MDYVFKKSLISLLFQSSFPAISVFTFPKDGMVPKNGIVPDGFKILF